MRWAPLTGVAFIVVAIIAFAIGGEPPEADQPVREIVSHYVDNKDSIQVSSALAALAGVLLVFFAGYLRKVLQAAEGSERLSFRPCAHRCRDHVRGNRDRRDDRVRDRRSGR